MLVEWGGSSQWEKADVGESQKEARVSIFLFLQIDPGILEAAEPPSGIRCHFYIFLW